MTLTGGDGLYVKDCYGCTFVDLVLDDNYRQACSVISASDTLFENCQFLNTGAHDRLQASFLAGLRCSHRWRCVAGMTGGTAPQAGVVSRRLSLRSGLRFRKTSAIIVRTGL